MAHLPTWITGAVAKIEGSVRNLWREIERDCRHVWEFLKASTKYAASLTTLLTVIIAGLTVRYTEKQWEEMQAARRPWLGMSERLVLRRPPFFSISEPRPFFEGFSTPHQEITAEFDVSGTIQNFGTSPAQQEVDGFYPWDEALLGHQFREFDCKNAENSLRRTPATRVIFPSVSLRIASTIQVQVEYSPNGISQITDQPLRTDLPEPVWIIGCVVYMDTGRSDPRRVIQNDESMDNTSDDLHADRVGTDRQAQSLEAK